MTTKSVLVKLRNNAAALKKEHQVSALYIFGSFARGKSDRNSDVDILVDFSSPNVGLFEFVRLKNHLEELLKRKVDLVTRDGLSESVRGDVERDSIRAA